MRLHVLRIINLVCLWSHGSAEDILSDEKRQDAFITFKEKGNAEGGCGFWRDLTSSDLI